MGFPTWTLVGMGLTAVGTLLMLVAAYVSQSPRLLKRLGLAAYRLDLRARAFTGYALAFFLLAFGFFLAGVPLGPRPEAEIATAARVTEVPITTPETAGEIAPVTDLEPAGGTPLPTATPTAATSDGSGQPETGAFGGPPPSARTATAVALGTPATGEAEPGEEGATAVPTPTPSSTPTGTASPTPTPSPTATATSLPTLTPTPIFEETAEVNTGTSTYWIRRTPGGRDLVLVRGGDRVILLPGHANLGGALWREVSTVDGVVGWIAEAYLSTGLEDASEVN